MKKKWKGALIGGIVGGLVSVLFMLLDSKIINCVNGLNLSNFFCSVSKTINNFGFLAGFFSVPKLFLKNILKLSGFSEILISPLMFVIFFVLGGLIGYLIYKSK